MNRLVWFRNDLRLLDNEPLTAATSEFAGSVAYVYIDDTRGLGDSRTSFAVSLQRRKFLAECLLDLQLQLRERGADLTCLQGDPTTLLPALCNELDIKDFYFSRLTAFNERRDQQTISSQLADVGVRVHQFQNTTLIHDQDVSFDPYKLLSFSRLRKRVEKSWPVRAPLTAPARLPKSLTTSRPNW
ncbi:MAG: deoxyribodipyrimidine photo-lyase, partial [Proteobacteria bacterium]